MAKWQRYMLGLVIMTAICVMTACHFFPKNQQDKTFTQQMMQPVIFQYCQNEVKNQPAWQGFRGLSDYAKQQTLNRVCGCVSRHAPNVLTINELAKASLDEQLRTTLAEKALSYSIDACVVEFGE